jgi:surface protein
MSNMFGNCVSLTSLPDISKWNISNDTEMFDMFWGCKSSLNIPSKFKK